MANMYFWANSRCRIESSVEKAAVFLHSLYIIGLKIVPREKHNGKRKNFATFPR